MALDWMRRALVAAASGALLLLAGCGSGTIESQLKPSRFVSFGDGFSDIGQGGASKLFTVNGETGNVVWTTEIVGGVYGMTLTPASSGGLSYAVGNARVVAKPDAVGNSATPTVKEQIDAFLAANTLGADDVVLINGGISDIVAQVTSVRAGTATSADATAAVGQAGRDLAAQVIRLVNAGAQHVLVVGTYDLGKTPWGGKVEPANAGLLGTLSAKFNEQLLVALVDYGKNVLYVDAAYEFNLFVNSPASFNFVNSTDWVCNGTSVDNGAAIGVPGTGVPSSPLCTTSTVSLSTYNTYVFADAVYPTPQVQRVFGDYAAGRLRARW